MDVDKVLAQRGARYGEFPNHATTAQTLKAVFRDGRKKAGRAYPMDALQQEAMDMILHKVARIANGDESYDDNWVDIAGYATLVANELQKPVVAGTGEVR